MNATIEMCGCSYTWGYDIRLLRSYPVRISCLKHLNDPQPEPPVIAFPSGG